MHILNYYLQFSNAIFLVFFLSPLFLYAVGKAVAWGMHWLLFRDQKSEDLIVVKFFTFIAIVIFAYAVALSLGIDVISSQLKAPAVAVASDEMMSADKMVFGVYLPLWFHSTQNPAKPFFDAMASLFLSAYQALTFVIGAVFSLLLIYEYRIFSKLLVSFVLTSFLGLPVWYLFPAISPFERYILNTTNVPISQSLQSEISSYEPNRQTVSFTKNLEQSGEISRNGFFAVTTFPSMHVAWASVITYFGIYAWPMSAVFLIPYSLLNAVGAVYTLQHYAVDALAGLVVAIISVLLTNGLFRLRWSDRSKPTITMTIQSDLKRLRRRNALSFQNVRRFIGGL